MPNGHGPPPDELDVTNPRSLGTFLGYIARVVYSDHQALEEIKGEVTSFALWKRTQEDDDLAAAVVLTVEQEREERAQRRWTRMKQRGEVLLVGIGIVGGVLSVVTVLARSL